MAKKDKNDIVILKERIGLGESRRIDFGIAKLYTATPVEIPVIIERSIHPGPTILITAALHGDEINGVEIVRQLLSRKLNKPKRGTIICIPILNVFGFLQNKDRKSTRLNSSHVRISYAVFCLKKKKIKQ